MQPIFILKKVSVLMSGLCIGMILLVTVQANTIYRLIEKKFGVAIVPTSLKNGYDLDIKFIELDNIDHKTTLQVIWSKKNTNPILKNALALI